MAIRPVITFNSGSGSDTAASGAGPGTALSGANAALASSTTVTLAVDAPDLSGVATDGSACMWVDSSSGRQFSRITATNNIAKTVTVATTYGVTESGRNWGIGGKRATLDDADSRALWADAQGGWAVELEDDQTITSALAPTVGGDSTDGAIEVRSNTALTKRTITNSANAAVFEMASANNQRWRFEDIYFANSNGTKTAAWGVHLNQASAGAPISFVRCGCTSTNKLQSFLKRTSGVHTGTLFHCQVDGCNSHGIDIGLNSATSFVGGSYSSNGGHGILFDAGVFVAVIGALITSNTTDGIILTGTWTQSTKLILGNTINGNTDGIDLSASATTANQLILANNIISNNTTGIRGQATIQDFGCAFNDYNNFFGNTTARTNWSAGANDTTLDPQFTNSAGGDFSVGANMAAIGYPIGGSILLGLATYTYTDMGAAQRQCVASSGGSAVAIFGG